VRVILNGEQIQDVNLDELTKPLHRDVKEKITPPLKDRPRRGHIGFQDLAKDARVQIRNVSLRVLDADGQGATTRPERRSRLNIPRFVPIVPSVNAAADLLPIAALLSRPSCPERPHRGCRCFPGRMPRAVPSRRAGARERHSRTEIDAC